MKAVCIKNISYSDVKSVCGRLRIYKYTYNNNARYPKYPYGIIGTAWTDGVDKKFWLTKQEFEEYFVRIEDE